MNDSREDFTDDTTYALWNLRRHMLTSRHMTALLILHFDGVEIMRVERDSEGFWLPGWWIMSARQACKLVRERGYSYYRGYTEEHWYHPTKRNISQYACRKSYWGKENPMKAEGAA